MSTNKDVEIARLAEKVAKLEEENKQLKQKKEVTIKVSEKGAIQINGIRRFPITLYKSEMEQILSKKEEIESFIQQNSDTLK